MMSVGMYRGSSQKFLTENVTSWVIVIKENEKEAVECIYAMDSLIISVTFMKCIT
jgi:hypothetical protein